MILTVIVPVGPGHEKYLPKSIPGATSRFTEVRYRPIYDTEGKLGRSKARNMGLEILESDWYFLMDADDTLMPDAFELCDFSAPATFGAVHLSDRPTVNIHPCGWHEVATYGALGTLCMGFFLRG